MSKIRLKKIKVKNYRSFGNEQSFIFPGENYKKPVSIIGYNNSGKTNLMSAILYGIGEKFVSANTFIKTDLHKLGYENNIEIETEIQATPYGYNYYGEQTIGGIHTVSTLIEDNEIKASCSPSFFGANKHYSIFYINFHKVKDEISTQKTSWGNLRSFLGKHIKNIVDSDKDMSSKRSSFEKETKASTKRVIANSYLSQFIGRIKANYSQNLRDNNCKIDFGLPEYEDIFLQMIFKIGLNGDTENFIPIDHFGDGYISMFVMAVIQAIAESDLNDKCLFLFEEPESFLHENHQEYFYKMVLCRLTQKGHQVIYTTHSDRMVDIFDTQSIIRIEFCEKTKQTLKKYNNIEEFGVNENKILSISNFNSYVKSVEPNLNRILFSRKVVLVEGPNDLMAYQYAIQKKVLSLLSEKDKAFAESYLNFHNISIAVHHGKSTALLLAALCQHFSIDYFIVSDWDLKEDFVKDLLLLKTESALKASSLYLKSSSHEKAAITNNWKLLSSSAAHKIHFNVPKLEGVLDYDSDDKDSLKIWNLLLNTESFSDAFFPETLTRFLEIDRICPTSINYSNTNKQETYDEIPF